MDDLFTTHEENGPSGPNLEYEPVFSQLELVAQPGQERQVGDAVIEAEDPDFSDVSRAARDVLALSHDLRAAVHLAHAELNLNGLAGLAEAARYIRFCLEDHWDTCHPQLDAEDDDDPTMRVNAVLGLADNDTIIRALRRAPLTQSTAFGRICLRDIEIAEGEIDPPDGEAVLDPAGVRAAFQDTPAETMQALDAAARDALDNVRAIDGVFAQRLPGTGPELGPLVRTLSRIAVQTGAFVGADAGDAEQMPDGPDAAPTSSPQATEGPGVPGRLDGQRDVLAALDAITDYYARHEPSSPVPLLLRRARRLVGADFLTIIEDIAPAGREQVTVVGGIMEDEGD